MEISDRGIKTWKIVLDTYIHRKPKSANEGSINFSPFSRSNGLIEITLLCLPNVLFCTLNNWNREFVSV